MNDKMGGPAFPTTHATETANPDYVIHHVTNGISVWDYYAAAASDEDIEHQMGLAGYTPGQVEEFKRVNSIDLRCWARGQHADAMLTERRKRMEAHNE